MGIPAPDFGAIGGELGDVRNSINCGIGEQFSQENNSLPAGACHDDPCQFHTARFLSFLNTPSGKVGIIFSFRKSAASKGERRM